MTVALPTIAATVACCGGFSFGKTLAKIERMVNDPLCSTGLLASVISSDPMLTARILGRANAALPRDHEPVIHLSTAVHRLGIAAVHGIIRQTRHVRPDSRRSMAAGWALANATATMVRVLADLGRQELREAYDHETLHCAGLLHNLGHLIILDQFRDAWAATQETVVGKNLSQRKALKIELGLHAGGVGMLLASSLGIPEPYAAVARYYETPDKARHEPTLVALVHVARRLVQCCGFLDPGQEFVEEIEPAAIDTLNLRVADLEIAIRVFFRDMEDFELYEGALAPAS